MLPCFRQMSDGIKPAPLALDSVRLYCVTLSLRTFNLSFPFVPNGKDNLHVRRETHMTLSTLLVMKGQKYIPKCCNTWTPLMGRMQFLTLHYKECCTNRKIISSRPHAFTFCTSFRISLVYTGEVNAYGYEEIIILLVHWSIQYKGPRQ